MRLPQDIIRRPLLTEKGSKLRETGGRSDAAEVSDEDLCPKVLFQVAKDANKIEIRSAIETLFEVQVKNVRTQVVRGRKKRLGKFMGKTSSWKKAIVTLAPGQQIEFFEGV